MITADQVRTRIAISGFKDDTVSMAKRLGVPARTFRRYLHKQGTTFLKIKDAARRECALGMIELDYAPQAIAAFIGFQETNSFFRKMKDWTGKGYTAYKEMIK